MSLERILKAESVAIVGASKNETKRGYQTIRTLLNEKYEGIIYNKTDDPLNHDGAMNLYAPDVTRGPDGRYYLYYVLDKVCPAEREKSGATGV